MAKKVLLIVFGSVLALIGVGLTVGGAVALALTGGDGYFGSDSSALSTPTRALVSEQLTDYADTNAGGLSATVRVRASSTAGDEVFLGVGRAAEVDRYLAGVAHDEVVDVEFSPFRYDTVRREGEQSPEPPADQSLWTARATGSGEQTLEFDLFDQDASRLVVMNADGSPDVDVRMSFAIRVPFLRRLGLGLVIGGVLGVLVGILLLVWGIRTKVPPRQPPAWGPYGYGYPPPAGYPPPGYAPPGYPPAGYPPAPGQSPPWGSYQPPSGQAPPPDQPSVDPDPPSSVSSPTGRPTDTREERLGPDPGTTGPEPGFADPTQPPRDAT